MFIDFFYTLKDVGVPVSPTSFLTLHKALGTGLINSLNDFYTSSRAILVKSERYFDLFDQVFAHHFQGAELPDYTGIELDEIARALLEHWLEQPEAFADALGIHLHGQRVDHGGLFGRRDPYRAGRSGEHGVLGGGFGGG